LKKGYNEFKKIGSRFEFDHSLKYNEAGERSWSRYFDENPNARKAWVNGLQFYDELRSICEGEFADGNESSKSNSPAKSQELFEKKSFDGIYC
jgi:hypothetical protein